MKENITMATSDGTLHTRDWDFEPLFPLKESAKSGDRSMDLWRGSPAVCMKLFMKYTNTLVNWCGIAHLLNSLQKMEGRWSHWYLPLWAQGVMNFASEEKQWRGTYKIVGLVVILERANGYTFL